MQKIADDGGSGITYNIVHSKQAAYRRKEAEDSRMKRLSNA
jgi:hypothetical protein